ncbi:MAG TPA: XRE family transcriptional regulator [Tissierellia bacterium]|nr:XRE family transcriptional regulator [Tissierellia bacterium]
MNILKIRGLMAEQMITQRAMAEMLGISLSSFHRKLKSGGNRFTLEELVKMKEALHLSDEEASEIFFD